MNIAIVIGLMVFTPISIVIFTLMISYMNSCKYVAIDSVSNICIFDKYRYNLSDIVDIYSQNDYHYIGGITEFWYSWLMYTYDGRQHYISSLCPSAIKICRKIDIKHADISISSATKILMCGGHIAHGILLLQKEWIGTKHGQKLDNPTQYKIAKTTILISNSTEYIIVSLRQIGNISLLLLLLHQYYGARSQ